MGEDKNTMMSCLLSEFVGTFLLVFTVGCVVTTGSAAWGATCIACVLMVMVYSLGSVSGAHFNPAVSFTMGLTKNLPWNNVAAYVGVQLMAGVLAGMAYGLTTGQVFQLKPGAGYAWWQAGLAECIYTCVLCFVVLNVAASKSHKGKDHFYGLAIGFVIVAGGTAAGHISGGCFNPAVAVGIDFPSFRAGFGWSVAYTVFELVGAVFAAFLFVNVRPNEYATDSENEKPLLGPRLLSEFFGTFVLVLTVGLSVLAKTSAAAFAIAASLMCMIYALGSVSGAHFNPAVTFTILLSGRTKIPLVDAACYVGMQFLGALCAAVTYALMENGRSFPLGPVGQFGYTSAGVAEIVFTFVLCFVVLCVATTKNALPEFYGLAIGSCVTVGGYAAGAISGASLNPAVSFGISLSHAFFGGGSMRSLLPYVVFELIGGVLAAATFYATHHHSEYAKGAGEISEEQKPLIASP